LIDGVVIEEHVLLVALGIDVDGNKHVLGVREGATENAASCTALVADMRERGLHAERAVLAVIDGSKALATPIRDVYGGRALIQRCQAHKARNVLDQLPDQMRPSVRQALRDAYGSADATRAKRLLTNLARRLRDEHPGAAASLDEGLDETLNVKRLGLPSKLERQLSTTNAIENLMGAVRRLTAREAVAWRPHDLALDGDRRRRRRRSLSSYHWRARRHDRAGPGAQRSRELNSTRCNSDEGWVVIITAILPHSVRRRMANLIDIFAAIRQAGSGDTQGLFEEVAPDGRYEWDECWICPPDPPDQETFSTTGWVWVHDPRRRRVLFRVTVRDGVISFSHVQAWRPGLQARDFG
jgi:hypothetical protein